MEKEIYHVLQKFADSWGLLGMFLVFMAVFLRTYFLPGRKTMYREAAEITMLPGDNLEDDLKALKKQRNQPSKETLK